MGGRAQRAPFYLSSREAPLEVERFVASIPRSSAPYGIGWMVAAADADESGSVSAPKPFRTTWSPSSPRAEAPNRPICSRRTCRRTTLDLRADLSGRSQATVFDVDPMTADVDQLLGFASVGWIFGIRGAFCRACARERRAAYCSVCPGYLADVLEAPSRFRAAALTRAARRGRDQRGLSDLPHAELRAIVTPRTRRALQKRERRLLHLANHDQLTGLYNRHRLIGELEAELERAAARGRRSALFFIDLDQFSM
jgi:hypothetical protein